MKALQRALEEAEKLVDRDFWVHIAPCYSFEGWYLESGFVHGDGFQETPHVRMVFSAERTVVSNSRI